MVSIFALFGAITPFVITFVNNLETKHYDNIARSIYSRLESDAQRQSRAVSNISCQPSLT